MVFYCGHWRSPESAERMRDYWRQYWHRTDGGYTRRRRHHLAEQRQQILEALHQTEEEIKALVAQS